MPEYPGAAGSRVSARRLHSLDLLRGLCALGVSAYHFSLWSKVPLPGPVKDSLAMFGTYGVSVFFVLSGYSLAHAYAGHIDTNLSSERLRTYFQRRLGRLGPLFGLIVLLSLFGKLLITKHIPNLYEVVANLTLVFGIFNPASTPVVGGWSIGVEVVYYILFPLLLLLRRSGLYIVMVAIFISAWVANEVRGYFALADAWRIYVHPANHAVFFVVGVYMRLLDHRVPQIARPMLLVILGLLLGIMAIASAQTTEIQLVTGWRRVFLVFASLVVVGATARIALRGSMAGFGSILGGLSYPLYLIHPILYFAVIGRVALVPAFVLGLLLIAVLFAIAADRWVDQPIQRYVKRLGW